MPISRLGINKLISLFFFSLFFFSPFQIHVLRKLYCSPRSENSEKIVELGLTLFTEEHDQISHRNVLLSCGFEGSSCEDHMCFCGSWIPTMPVSFSRFGPYSC